MGIYGTGMTDLARAAMEAGGEVASTYVHNASANKRNTQNMVKDALLTINQNRQNSLDRQNQLQLQDLRGQQQIQQQQFGALQDELNVGKILERKNKIADDHKLGIIDDLHAAYLNKREDQLLEKNPFWQQAKAELDSLMGQSQGGLTVDEPPIGLPSSVETLPNGANAQLGSSNAQLPTPNPLNGATLSNEGSLLSAPLPKQSGGVKLQQLKEFAGPELSTKISAAAAKNGVPENLAFALLMKESTLGRNKKHSSAGAIGIGQLMPGTAADLGVDPYNPDQNLDGSMRYLKQQIDKYGLNNNAIAAYNAGPGKVDYYKGIPPYKETQDYVNVINSYLDEGVLSKPQQQQASYDPFQQVTQPKPVDNNTFKLGLGGRQVNPVNPLSFTSANTQQITGIRDKLNSDNQKSIAVDKAMFERPDIIQKDPNTGKDMLISADTGIPAQNVTVNRLLKADRAEYERMKISNNTKYNEIRRKDIDTIDKIETIEGAMTTLTEELDKIYQEGARNNPNLIAGFQKSFAENFNFFGSELPNGALAEDVFISNMLDMGVSEESARRITSASTYVRSISPTFVKGIAGDSGQVTNTDRFISDQNLTYDPGKSLGQNLQNLKLGLLNLHSSKADLALRHGMVDVGDVAAYNANKIGFSIGTNQYDYRKPIVYGASGQDQYKAPNPYETRDAMGRIALGGAAAMAIPSIAPILGGAGAGILRGAGGLLGKQGAKAATKATTKAATKAIANSPLDDALLGKAASSAAKPVAEGVKKVQFITKKTGQLPSANIPKSGGAANGIIAGAEGLGALGTGFALAAAPEQSINTVANSFTRKSNSTLPSNNIIEGLELSLPDKYKNNGQLKNKVNNIYDKLQSNNIKFSGDEREIVHDIIKQVVIPDNSSLLKSDAYLKTQVSQLAAKVKAGEKLNESQVKSLRRILSNDIGSVYKEQDIVGF